MTYHRFFNQRCADPVAAVAAIQNVATRVAQRYKQFFILDYNMIDDELADARAARVELEVVNPGISGVVGGNTPYLVVWEEFGPDDTPADCTVRICCMGQIVGIPSGLSSGTLRMVLDCRPATWEKTAMGLWETQLPAAIPATDVLPYADKILTNSDFIESTWFVPRINPYNWNIDIVPVVNMNDVNPALAAGNVAGGDGSTIYDLTSFVLEDELDFAIAQAPVLTVAGELTVAWNQRASGFMDLGGAVQSAILGGGKVDDAGHLLTFTPEAFQSSLPHKGSDLTTGVKIFVANYDTVAGSLNVTYETSGLAAVATYTGEGYGLMGGGTNTGTIRWGGFMVAAGGGQLVAIFDYHQPRQEAVDIVVNMDVQPFTTTISNYIEFKSQPLNDPTVYPNLKLWIAHRPYARGDVVYNAGANYQCLFAHVAGATFDATNWIQISVPNYVGATPQAYNAGQAYVEGDIVLQAGTVYICMTATTGAFDVTKWQDAAGTAGFVVNWTPLTNYNSGQIVYYVLGKQLYVTPDNQTSGLHFDASLWEIVSEALTNVALWPGAPEFLSTPRGATSIIWQQIRAYSLGLKRANALKGTFMMPYGVDIDGTLNTANMRKGTLFRIRNTKLPGGFSEIYGIVTSVNIRLNGDKGTAEVRCGFRVAIGNGMNAGCTKEFQIPSTFTFQPSFQLVNTATLGSTASVIKQVNILGDDYDTQQSTIDAIFSAGASGFTGGNGFEATAQNALMANPTRIQFLCQPLETLDLPVLDHGAMVTPPMYVPKGIILS